MYLTSPHLTSKEHACMHAGLRIYNLSSPVTSFSSQLASQDQLTDCSVSILHCGRRDAIDSMAIMSEF